MMKRTPSNQQAFTILELMIATMVFSVILLLVTTGILQIGKTYYQGALQSRTQETARNIIDEISRGIQFSGETVITTTGFSPISNPYRQPGRQYIFCVNGIGYSYIIDRQLAQTPSGPDQVSKTLIAYRATCNSFTPPDLIDPASIFLESRELLGFGMRLTDLNVELVPGTSDVYAITVEVASGERDLFDPNNTALISTSCKSRSGRQFCAVSKLTTIVQKRVK